MRIHFIGIGGVGINALAKFALDMGVEVSGSDARLNSLAKGLVGARVYEGIDPCIAKSADLVVYTQAVREDHPELVAAISSGVTALPREEFLRAVSKLFGGTVAVAGTHGKTTTTAMLTHILHAAGKNFASMIGGESVDFSNYVNNISGRGDNAIQDELFGIDIRVPSGLKDGAFVVEACEYKRSFLRLDPHIGVVTNVECDHPDCYSSIDSVREAFGRFVDKSECTVLPKGLFDGRGESQNNFEVVARKDKEETAFLLSQNDIFAKSPNGRIEKVGTLALKDGGGYDLKNALFAVAASSLMSVRPSDAIEALKTFNGVKRRFERVGDIDGVPVFFDFAHHPTEIACVLDRAAKRYGKILAVFQPHTYSRTKAYFDDFVRALSSANTVALLPTYAARELPSAGLDSQTLFEALKSKGSNAHMCTRDGILPFVKSLAGAHDVVLFVGAGDIYSLKDDLSKFDGTKDAN